MAVGTKVVGVVAASMAWGVEVVDSPRVEEEGVETALDGVDWDASRLFSAFCA